MDGVVDTGNIHAALHIRGTGEACEETARRHENVAGQDSHQAEGRDVHLVDDLVFDFVELCVGHAGREQATDGTASDFKLVMGGIEVLRDSRGTSAKRTRVEMDRRADVALERVLVSAGSDRDGFRSPANRSPDVR